MDSSGVVAREWSKEVDLKSRWGCKATSVVYFLFCANCSLGYVGATSRELSKRFSEHLGKIRNSAQEIQTVHLHFKLGAPSCLPLIGILEKVPEENLLRLKNGTSGSLNPTST